MKDHINFYENLKEAQMRLRGTVVMYDGEPYYVLAITNHKKDDIFRIYLDPIGWAPNERRNRPQIMDYGQEDPALGVMIDAWMDANKDAGLLRKMMNSKLFNNYRPYPLGMCNIGKNAYYVERQPNRKTEQGLIKSMLQETLVSTGGESAMKKSMSGSVDCFSVPFRSCILADHPSPTRTLEALMDPTIDNQSVAFHRDFALARGPIDMLFLAYKGDIVGVLPKNDFSTVRLGREFKHTKEAVASLKLFNDII